MPHSPMSTGRSRALPLRMNNSSTPLNMEVTVSPSPCSAERKTNSRYSANRLAPMKHR